MSGWSQSPTFLVASAVAFPAAAAAFRAVVPVAFALLLGRADCFLAVVEVVLAARSALPLAVLAVAAAPFLAWVLVVLALDTVVLPELAAT